MTEKRVFKDGNTKGNIKSGADREQNVRPSSPPSAPKPKELNKSSL